MRIAFYEDGSAANLRPLIHLRPVFELLCGQFSPRERLLRTGLVSAWGAFLRGELAEVYREEQPEARVNDCLWLAAGATVLINGRWLAPSNFLENVQPDEAGRVGETLVYLTVDPLEAPLLADHNFEACLARLAASRRVVPAGGRLIEHPWDLVEANGAQLRDDCRDRLARSAAALSPTRNFGPQVAIVGPPEDVYVDAAATIDPFVVFDSRKGPVWVEPGAHLGSFTQLEGPCYVGQRSQLFRAQVRAATTIGPECRVGGELECSILHGYANKYHLGFFGHAYACPWVNIGALATNSDLKSDYSPVHVPLWGEPIESGLTKVGCFIGDHTKIAIGSLFNTGASIGVMCLILPNGGLLPRHIPSFSRLWHGELAEEGDLEHTLQAARIAMGRRNCELTAAQERLLRHLHVATRDERETAAVRFREKRRATAELPR
jgi:UDP-N-acetylglucosamine diphosphorylase/glucosamine-1-phosphate N-acetyltransferase